MPNLDWIGKKKVINHHQEVAYKFLNPLYSFGEKNENMIIQGDNLHILKSLLPQYEGQIKLIYLDPPYNTGKSEKEGGWVYNDNVNDPQIQKWLGEVVGPEGEDLSRHDKWLCMMYPRLKLVHKLLAEDGVVFVSIDDNEFKNLKHILDEIFGEHNFITNFAVENNPKGRKNNLFVSDSYEYCLLYCKNKKLISDLVSEKDPKKFFNDIVFDNSKDKRKILQDEHGTFKQSKRQVVGTNKSNALCSASNIDRCFVVYHHDKKDEMILLDEYSLVDDDFFLSPKGQELIDNGYLRYIGYKKGTKKPIIPLYSKETLFEMHKNHKLFFKDDGTIYEKDRKSSMQVTSLLTNKKFGIDLMTESAKALLEDIFQEPNKFPNPKNVEFIKALISLYPDKKITVLDPFAGSGTTGHAVLELNQADKGKRNFILIEMNNYANSTTAQRIKIITKGFSGRDPIKGGFTFYEMGDELFGPDGLLNKNISNLRIKEYVYFMETKNKLDNLVEDSTYLGSSNNTGYYFISGSDNPSVLNHKFFSKIKKKEDQYVIYADICTLSEDELKKYNIVFKKISRDIIRL